LLKRVVWTLTYTARKPCSEIITHF
jgi:hypothetical protein